MKKVLKVFLLLSVLAASLLSCSHLFEDDVEVGDGDSGGGVDRTTVVRTTVDGREVSDKDDTLDNILKAAGLAAEDPNDNNKIKIKADASGKRPAGFLVKKPDGTSEFISVDSTNGDYTDSSGNAADSTPIPKGTIINSKNPTDPNKNIVPFVFDYGTDAAGNKYQKTVPIELSGTTADWSDIQTEASKNGVNLFPDGYALKTLDGKTNTGNTFNPNLTAGATPINIVFEKDVSYKIVYGPTNADPTSYNQEKEAKYIVQYPKTYVEKPLKDIFNDAMVDSHTAKTPSSGDAVYLPINSGKVFTGWTVDGKSDLFKPSEIDNNKRGNQPLENVRSGSVIRAKIETPRSISLGGGENIGTTEIREYQMGDFYIQNTEITRGQWKAVMLKTGGDVNNDADWYVDGGATQWAQALNTGNNQDLTMPMNFVSWYDAVMFCNRLSVLNKKDPYYYYVPGKKGKDDPSVVPPVTSGTKDTEKWRNPDNGAPKLYTPTIGVNQAKPNDWGRIYCDTNANGYRLPTLEEWKYAAHGGAGQPYTKYSGTTGIDSTALNSVAWWGNKQGTTGNSAGKVHPVGEKGGDYPVRDMSGNVWEWTMEEDVHSPDRGYTHLYKGGAYDAPDTFAPIDNETGNRDNGYYGKTGDRSTGIGFRIMEYKN